MEKIIITRNTAASGTQLTVGVVCVIGKDISDTDAKTLIKLKKAEPVVNRKKKAVDPLDIG